MEYLPMTDSIITALLLKVPYIIISLNCLMDELTLQGLNSDRRKSNHRPLTCKSLLGAMYQLPKVVVTVNNVAHIITSLNTYPRRSDGRNIRNQNIRVASPNHHVTILATTDNYLVIAYCIANPRVPEKQLKLLPN